MLHNCCDSCFLSLSLIIALDAFTGNLFRAFYNFWKFLRQRKPAMGRLGVRLKVNWSVYLTTENSILSRHSRKPQRSMISEYVNWLHRLENSPSYWTVLIRILYAYNLQFIWLHGIYRSLEAPSWYTRNRREHWPLSRLLVITASKWFIIALLGIWWSCNAVYTNPKCEKRVILTYVLHCSPTVLQSWIIGAWRKENAFRARWYRDHEIGLSISITMCRICAIE